MAKPEDLNRPWYLGGDAKLRCGFVAKGTNAVGYNEIGMFVPVFMEQAGAEVRLNAIGHPSGTMVDVAGGEGRRINWDNGTYWDDRAG
jgi:hypothetical protein